MIKKSSEEGEADKDINEADQDKNFDIIVVQELVFISEVQEAGAGEKKQENENYIEFIIKAIVIHNGFLSPKR